MLTITILLLFLSTALTHEEEAEGLVIKQHKVHTAEYAIACGMRYSDLNHDGRLSKKEAAVIRALALGVVREGVAEILEHFVKAITIEQVFRDCDADGDGFITIEDFHKKRATCLETQSKIDQAIDYVCKKGAAGVFAHAKVDE